MPSKQQQSCEVTPLMPSKLSLKYPGLHWLLSATGVDDLAESFGCKLLIMLFASQHLMKGFATSFTGLPASFLYKAYKVPGPQLQIFGGVTQLPWAMKPVIGLISDAFPIRGYHKAPYIAIASVLGVAALLMVGAVPQNHMSVERLVICFFLMQVQFSTCDLLTEAKYAEKMQSQPEHGPALMTYVWFGLQLGGLAAVALVGPVMDHLGIRAPYIIAFFPVAFIFIPLAYNYMEETPRTDADAAEARRRLLEQHEACILCLLMLVATIVLSGLGIFYQSPVVNAAAALVVAVVMLAAFSILLRPIIAKVNAFFLIQTSLAISISGASFYFFTDTPEQFPDGPHFSMEFFTSVIGVVGAVCSLVGIYTYQKYMSSWGYRSLLLMTNLIFCVLSFSDLVIFTRLNLRLGIPDRAFVLGGSALTSVVSQWMWMPGVVILSQLCPKGMEATMYALLAGCHNLGNTIASSCGALLLDLLGCNPNGLPGESEQFDRLWVASAVSTVMPMVTLLLLPWLIPDARQTDKLLDENDRDATTGSLWKQWTGESRTPSYSVASSSPSTAASSSQSGSPMSSSSPP